MIFILHIFSVYAAFNYSTDYTTPCSEVRYLSSIFKHTNFELRSIIDGTCDLPLGLGRCRDGRKAGMAPQRAHTLDSNEFYYSARSGLSCLDRTHLARLVFQALAYPF